MGWFHFSFPDFCYAFISILLEGIPFVVLGTLLSGLIDQFLPARVMTRLLPKNAAAGIFLSGALGVVFPMCECGIVPVIRRLMAKGLPVANAITYMLAAPIVNPVVAISTFAAFRGQGALEMTGFRLGLGYLVAVICGFAVLNIRLKHILNDQTLAAVNGPGNSPTGLPSLGGTPLGLMDKLGNALRVAVKDFLDVSMYFVLGAGVASVFNTGVNQEVILPLALETWKATFAMMGFAAVLSLCSTSDAFIAATLTAFPPVAKLAFLVFGPMMDLKLLFIYSAVFRKRFVLGLAVGLFILIGLICIRLAVLEV